MRKHQGYISWGVGIILIVIVIIYGIILAVHHNYLTGMGYKETETGEYVITLTDDENSYYLIKTDDIKTAELLSTMKEKQCWIYSDIIKFIKSDDFPIKDKEYPYEKYIFDDSVSLEIHNN